MRRKGVDACRDRREGVFIWDARQPPGRHHESMVLVPSESTYVVELLRGEERDLA